MYKNVESFERLLRVLVGLVFLSLAIAGPRTIWGLLGLVPLITGATGHCPLYTLLAGLPPSSRHHHAH
ncbi:MAG TPA: DUF2892 domain-containing protein [Polyangiaceae bacterium]|nr:DUF2892 domain-containing protein [Polyangiaceae bacterium]